MFKNLRTLDTHGLLCPMPVIKTQNAVAKLSPGELLKVTSSDFGSLLDIPSWCRVHGHTILSITKRVNEICILIQIAPK